MSFMSYCPHKPICLWNSILRDIVQKRGKKKTFVLKKSPYGKIMQAQPMISPNQRGQRKKRKGGCKEDGIQTGDGKADFEWEGICFNAGVMAIDGLNPPSG